MPSTDLAVVQSVSIAFWAAVGGRMVAVQPDTQIVEPIEAWVTSGLSAPGVQAGSGNGRSACEHVAVTVLTGAADRKMVTDVGILRQPWGRGDQARPTP
jgi:hypothetical protein